jgi:hypothetical protein
MLKCLNYIPEVIFCQYLVLHFISFFVPAEWPRGLGLDYLTGSIELCDIEPNRAWKSQPCKAHDSAYFLLCVPSHFTIGKVLYIFIVQTKSQGTVRIQKKIYYRTTTAKDIGQIQNTNLNFHQRKNSFQIYPSPSTVI